jgi:aconitate hydratase
VTSQKTISFDNYLESFSIDDQRYEYISLKQVVEAYDVNLDTLPIVMRILLENSVRNSGSVDDHKAIINWREHAGLYSVPFQPSRILMQDFTGVPAIVDLATMRDATVAQGKKAERVNPKCQVDLVIDHSVSVDSYGNAKALSENVEVEMKRNKERYQFLKWGQAAFSNFRVVPPGNGICHQVNLEYLAPVVALSEAEDAIFLQPDTLVGTDSHTTMINAIGVLGWGVGGIEAEAAMLGQPLDLVIPKVTGVRLTGALSSGVTATDLVLNITERLRKEGVVGHFVEFFGPGVSRLSLSERATISNMSPEFGSTCAFFPIDEESLQYLRITGRPDAQVDIIARYCMEQGLWHQPNQSTDAFTQVIEIDLSSVAVCLAGPKRPQDKVALSALGLATEKSILKEATGSSLAATVNVTDHDYQITHGDVVIAAITSCTNTSNPSVLIMAGLLAKKAIERGLTVKPWVKTSFAPGSKVVVSYLEALGLLKPLEALGFFLAGYGCTTCIGNSGPLRPEISQAITENDLCVSAVLSGNRNFEGRIHPDVSMNWLASPPLVVAFALTGTTRINLDRDKIGDDQQDNPVFLSDIWPDAKQVEQLQQEITADMFNKQYQDLFVGDKLWDSLPVTESTTYTWQPSSTYIQSPTFFDNLNETSLTDICGGRVLVLLSDSVTTDHISPAGFIPSNSPAGRYLIDKQVHERSFNSYGARRGNHHVMVRGTFANIKLKNDCVENLLGGYTTHWPTGEIMPIYDAAMRYKSEKTPLVVIAGKEYGTGSSRDWAAKGTMMLGVKVVIAESFERIHRSNLVGMGVLPCELIEYQLTQLALTGEEIIDILGISDIQQPHDQLTMRIQYVDKSTREFQLLARLDTKREVQYYQSKGVLPYVLKEIIEND